MAPITWRLRGLAAVGGHYASNAQIQIHDFQGFDNAEKWQLFHGYICIAFSLFVYPFERHCKILLRCLGLSYKIVEIYENMLSKHRYLQKVHFAFYVHCPVHTQNQMSLDPWSREKAIQGYNRLITSAVVWNEFFFAESCDEGATSDHYIKIVPQRSYRGRFFK